MLKVINPAQRLNNDDVECNKKELTILKHTQCVTSVHSLFLCMCAIFENAQKKSDEFEKS